MNKEIKHVPDDPHNKPWYVYINGNFHMKFETEYEAQMYEAPGRAEPRELPSAESDAALGIIRVK